MSEFSKFVVGFFALFAAKELLDSSPKEANGKPTTDSDISNNSAVADDARVDGKLPPEDKHLDKKQNEFPSTDGSIVGDTPQKPPRNKK